MMGNRGETFRGNLGGLEGKSAVLPKTKGQYLRKYGVNIGVMFKFKRKKKK